MNTTEQKVQKVNTSEVRFIIAMRKTTVVEKNERFASNRKTAMKAHF